MKPFASGLCAFAARLLPSRRRLWGEAMRAELAYVPPGPEAIVYGVGCLWAAGRERARDFDTVFGAGLWVASVVGVAFACFHIACAAHGVAVLRGAPDGFLDQMLSSGPPDPRLIERYMAARPIVIGCLFGLGAAHLGAAWFLARRQWRRFTAAWCLALAIGLSAVGIQLSIVWSPDGLPTELAALGIQAVILSALLHWARIREAEETQ